MGQAVSFILRCICGEAEEEERSNEQENLQTCLLKSNSCSNSKTTSDHISRFGSPTSLLSCIDSSTANNVVKHRFKVNHSSILVIDDKLQNSCFDSTNIDQALKPYHLYVASSTSSVPIPIIDSSIVVEDKRQVYPITEDLNINDPKEEEEEEESKKAELCKEVVIKERKIKHYSSSQKILVVGDKPQNSCFDSTNIDQALKPYHLYVASSTSSVPIPIIDSSTVVEDKRHVYPVTEDLNINDPKEEEESKKAELCKEVVVKERRIKHYSSSQKILVVGDGDFSFSACLAMFFGSASNMVATSLDSKTFLRKNYKKAMSNIGELKRRGCIVMHGVDATEMACNSSFTDYIFDRIVYNFPLVGFFPKTSQKKQLKWNRKLIIGFLENAKEMMTEDGEIHITHKSNGFFLDWKLPVLASSNVGLRLIEEVPFNLNDYEGYNTKYGFGGDDNFNCNPSKTYKFGLKQEKVRFSFGIQRWEVIKLKL